MMSAKAVLPPLWEVPQGLRDRLGEEAGRQRAILADGHLLLVVHRPPRPEEVQRKGRFFWRTPDGSWTCSDLGGGPSGLRRHLDECADRVAEYDRMAEQAVEAEDYFEVLNGLAPLHRTIRHLHQMFQEARSLCPKDRDLIVFRDRAYEIERTAELLYQETKNGLDFQMARQAEEQAKNSYRMAVSAYRLNLLAAFFFPLVTLSAVFGMNLSHGLERAYAPLPFLGILAAGLLFGFVLQSSVTRPPQPRQSLPPARPRPPRSRR